MDRLEQLRQQIDEIVGRNPDREEARCGFVHLYGVSAVCAMLALRRGLDSELCATAGMLHDIWNYQNSDHPDHARLGAEESEKILRGMGSYSEEEIRAVCGAIACHSDKVSINDEMAELLKDADGFQHYLYNPGKFLASARHGGTVKEARAARVAKVLGELGIPTTRTL